MEKQNKIHNGMKSFKRGHLYMETVHTRRHTYPEQLTSSPDTRPQVTAVSHGPLPFFDEKYIIAAQ